jgi:hypothetical protein
MGQNLAQMIDIENLCYCQGLLFICKGHRHERSIKLVLASSQLGELASSGKPCHCRTYFPIFDSAMNNRKIIEEHEHKK